MLQWSELMETHSFFALYIADNRQAAFKDSGVEVSLQAHDRCEDNIPMGTADENLSHHLGSQRVWLEIQQHSCSLQQAASAQQTADRHIGTYALTTDIAPWVKNALANYRPRVEVSELVRPLALKLHASFKKEKDLSSGLHDLDTLLKSGLLSSMQQMLLNTQ